LFLTVKTYYFRIVSYDKNLQTRLWLWYYYNIIHCISLCVYVLYVHICVFNIILLLCRSRGLHRTVKRARESGGGGLRSVRSPTASVLVAASAKSHRLRSSSEWQTHYESCRKLHSTGPHRLVVRCTGYTANVYFIFIIIIQIVNRSISVKSLYIDPVASLFSALMIIIDILYERYT